MKTSHKIILLASVLCLYPLMSDAKVRKINEYKQNAFTNYVQNAFTNEMQNGNGCTGPCCDTVYAKNHPQQCGSIYCQYSGYDTTSGPASDVDKRCFTNPNGTKISNVTCYKYKNGNESDSAYPFDQATCVGDNGVLGVLSGDHKTLYDCANGKATAHEYYKECNCPSGTIEIALNSGAEKSFSYEKIKLSNGKLCVKESSIACKDGNYTLLKKSGSTFTINGKSFQSPSSVSLSGKMVEITTDTAPKPVFAFSESVTLDKDKTFTCFNREKFQVKSLMSSENMPTSAEVIKSDGTYGNFMAMCLLLNEGILRPGNCASNPAEGVYAAFYHTYACLDDFSVYANAGTHFTPCQISGIGFKGFKTDKQIFEQAYCYKKCDCTSANDAYTNGNLYGTTNDNAFSLGDACLISCNSGAGYVEAYKGSSSSCGNFCPNDANATIPGNMSGFSNGDTQYAYSLKKIVKGAGTLVCGTPVGCNVSANYIPTTGCLADSWCSWFNKD